VQWLSTTGQKSLGALPRQTMLLRCQSEAQAIVWYFDLHNAKMLEKGISCVETLNEFATEEYVVGYKKGYLGRDFERNYRGFSEEGQNSEFKVLGGIS
jgi:hypothetical protein